MEQNEKMEQNKQDEQAGKLEKSQNKSDYSIPVISFNVDEDEWRANSDYDTELSRLVAKYKNQSNNSESRKATATAFHEMREEYSWARKSSKQHKGSNLKVLFNLVIIAVIAYVLWTWFTAR